MVRPAQGHLPQTALGPWPTDQEIYDCRLPIANRRSQIQKSKIISAACLSLCPIGRCGPSGDALRDSRCKRCSGRPSYSGGASAKSRQSWPQQHHGWRDIYGRPHQFYPADTLYRAASCCSHRYDGHKMTRDKKRSQHWPQRVGWPAAQPGSSRGTQSKGHFR